MTHITDLTLRIKHIKYMEECFDKFSHNTKNNELKAILSDYYDSGQWLYDYTLDEMGLLPKDLKKGVLSQDGLYNLLCE